jgi:hypothetical protein
VGEDLLIEGDLVAPEAAFAEPATARGDGTNAAPDEEDV